MILYGSKMTSLIAIQECSSSKRKEMWKTIQTKANDGRPVQLILDMKVLWSSTYLMLDQAERKKEVRSKFSSKDYPSHLFLALAVH
jgi:hypothetical protein